MMRQIFNEIIKRNNFTPDEWKKVKIKVIYKKGDVEDVSNYRPICSLPEMYKRRDAKSGESKCGLRRLTSRRRSTPSPTTLSGRHSYLAMSIMDTFASCGKFTKIRRRQYRQTKRVKFSIFQKAPNKVIRCPACCSTRYCSTH